MKKIFSILSLVSLALTGCLKDTAPNDFKSVQPILEMPYHGLANFSKDAVVAAGQVDPITKTFTINLASIYTLGTNVSYTLAVDDAKRTAYNAANVNQYLLLPDSCFSFVKKTGIIEAGTRLDTFSVTYFPTKIDPTKNYMLPISITTANGVTVSGNFGTAYYHFIGNPLAGNYTHNYVRWNSASTAGAPTTTSTDVITALPDDPTTLEFQTGYGVQNAFNARCIMTFTNTAGVFSNFAITFNPDDVVNSFTPSSITLITAPTFIYADGVLKNSSLLSRLLIVPALRGLSLMNISNYKI